MSFIDHKKSGLPMRIMKGPLSGNNQIEILCRFHFFQIIFIRVISCVYASA